MRPVAAVAFTQRLPDLELFQLVCCQWLRVNSENQTIPEGWMRYPVLVLSELRHSQGNEVTDHENL